MTVVGQWPEPVEVSPNRFWLLNETGARMYFIDDARLLPDFLDDGDPKMGEELSGYLYYLVPLGCEPLILYVQIFIGDLSIPIDPGPP